METQLKEIALQLKNLNNKFQQLLDATAETKKKFAKIGSEGEIEDKQSEK